MTESKDLINNQSIVSSNSSSSSVFSLEYLKKNLQLIDVSVPSYQTDFMDHTNYKIVFFLQPKQTIYVTIKRFNDFVALNDVIKMKLENIEMKSFPSKFQIWNKSETRRAYFDEMMKRLLRAAKQHQQIRHQVLSIIISFVNLKHKAGKEDVVRDKVHSKSSIFSQQDQEIEKTNANAIPTPQQITKVIEKAADKAQQEQRLIDQGEIKIDDKSNVTMMKFQKDDDWKKKYLRVKDDKLQIYRSIAYNTFETQVELYGCTVEYLTQDLTFVDEVCLKMQFRDDPPVYPKNFKYLSLYHEYDSQKLIFTSPDAVQDKPCDALEELRIRLVKASHQARFSSEYKGFFSVTGKVYIALYGFKLLKDLHTILQEKSKDKDDHHWVLVKIRTEAFNYETKKVELKMENIIKQGFIIPITSVFEDIHIQLVQIEMKGWLKEEQKQKILGRYILRVSDILSYNRGYNFQKVIFRIQETEGGSGIASMTATVRNLSQLSSIYSESFASENDGEYINYQEMSIRQTLNAVTMTLDRLLYIFGKIGLFCQTLWRNIYCFKYPRLAIYVLINLALAFAFLDMSNILVFFTIALCSVIIYNHREVYPIVEEISDKFFTGESHKHSRFISPRILSVRSQFKYMKWAHNHIHLKQRMLEKSGQAALPQAPSKQITFEKTKNFFFLKKGGNLYKIEDEEIGIFDKVSDIKFTIQQIHNTINSIVNVVEKIGSLFTWVDFRRTLYVLVVVVSLVLISNALAFRFLGVALCIHRYIKGMRYYKKHYARNRKLAEQCLKYILNKSFKDIKKQLDSKPIERVTFPIQQQDFKKLKQQIENIIPVCINASEMSEIQQMVKKLENNEASSLNRKALREKYLPYIEGDKIRLSFFIDMIESCESRLKLERIITNEGRTQQYQDLRNITKQRPVIDIWLEQMIKNYILNTPSLFYQYINHSSDSIVDRHEQQSEVMATPVEATPVKDQLAPLIE